MLEFIKIIEVMGVIWKLFSVPSLLCKNSNYNIWTLKEPTTPSKSLMFTVVTPNTLIGSFKSIFFLSISILYCSFKFSAISFAVIEPNIFWFSPDFTEIFNVILFNFSAYFFVPINISRIKYKVKYASNLYYRIT